MKADLVSKVKKALTSSLLISPERRDFYLALAEQLTVEQLHELLSILEFEDEAIHTMLKQHFADEKTGSDLSQEFEAFMAKLQKEMIGDLHQHDTEVNQAELDKLELELNDL